MKLCQKIGIGCAAVVFLFGLWMQSWFGPDESDDELEDDWPSE